MSVTVLLNVPSTNAVPALAEALRVALGNKYSGVQTGPGAVVVHLTADATPADENTARQTVLNHDFETRTEEQIERALLADQSSGVIAQYLASPLSNRTPQDLYNEVQSEINGWTTLAEAKTDLQQWLPFVAALCQLIVRRIKVGDL